MLIRPQDPELVSDTSGADFQAWQHPFLVIKMINFGGWPVVGSPWPLQLLSGD